MKCFNNYSKIIFVHLLLYISLYKSLLMMIHEIHVIVNYEVLHPSVK